MRRKTNVTIAPGVYLAVCRVKNQQRFRRIPIGSVDNLNKLLKKHRQQFLGATVEIKKLVRCDSDAAKLADYLGKVTTVFLRTEHAKNNRSHVDDDWCFWFYYYNLQLFLHNNFRYECLDDLIELAQAYEVSHNIIHIVWTENLPPQLAKEAGGWNMEHDAAPTFLTRCVTAAIAVLLGVMPEPDFEEE